MNSNVIDFVAQDVEDLLTLLDGRDVEILGEPWTIDTSELKLEAVEKNPLEHFLEFISSPDVAFILLTVGGLGIVVELFNPGLIAPGVVGVILLILAFLALGNLPVNWAGVALIVLAIVLALLETQVIGFGILGIGSVICLVLGGFLLFAPIWQSLANLAVDQRESLAHSRCRGNLRDGIALSGVDDQKVPGRRARAWPGRQNKPGGEGHY